MSCYVNLDMSNSSPNYPTWRLDINIPSSILQEIKRLPNGNYEFHEMKIIKPANPSSLWHYFQGICKMARI